MTTVEKMNQLIKSINSPQKYPHSLLNLAKHKGGSAAHLEDSVHIDGMIYDN